MADDDKSFLLVLRDAAKDCPDPIVREALKLKADRLDALIGNLNDTSTMNDMRALTADWVWAANVLPAATTPGGTTPRADSGSAEEVKLARAA
jgi:hypothetical protein